MNCPLESHPPVQRRVSAREPSLRVALRCATHAHALRAPAPSGLCAHGAPRGAGRRDGALACGGGARGHRGAGARGEYPWRGHPSARPWRSGLK